MHRSVHLQLGVDGELDAVVKLAKALNLFVGPRFLPAELVAREPQDHEPPILVLDVERLEALVLGVNPHLLATLTMSMGLP